MTKSHSLQFNALPLYLQETAGKWYCKIWTVNTKFEFVKCVQVEFTSKYRPLLCGRASRTREWFILFGASTPPPFLNLIQTNLQPSQKCDIFIFPSFHPQFVTSSRILNVSWQEKHLSAFIINLAQIHSNSTEIKHLNDITTSSSITSNI